MLNAINTKILLAILAALGAICALLVHQEHASETAAVAAKAAVILQQSEQEQDALRKENEGLQRTIQSEREKHAHDNRKPSKTWQTYVP